MCVGVFHLSRAIQDADAENSDYTYWIQ